MKSLKTILTVVVLGAIGVFVILWSLGSWNHTTGKSNIKAVNQFVLKIKQQKDSLGRFPENKFSTAYYDDVKAELETFYSNGDLGESGMQNDSVYKKLAQSLLVTYVSSFTEETFFVFDQPKVGKENFRHIKNEVGRIKNSQYFLHLDYEEKISFMTIQKIVSNYSKINDFINQCKDFRYTNYGIYANFPANKIKGWIEKSKGLQQKDYVQKVKYLKEALQEIPQLLFENHVSYLKYKVKKHGDDYDCIFRVILYHRFRMKPYHGFRMKVYHFGSTFSGYKTG